MNNTIQTAINVENKKISIAIQDIENLKTKEEDLRTIITESNDKIETYKQAQETSNRSQAQKSAWFDNHSISEKLKGAIVNGVYTTDKNEIRYYEDLIACGYYQNSNKSRISVHKKGQEYKKFTINLHNLEGDVKMASGSLNCRGGQIYQA